MNTTISGHPVHPALRTLGQELKATLIRLGVYVGAIAALVVLAARFFATPEVNAAVDRSAHSDWTVLDRPYQAFALSIPGMPEADFAIQRHRAGGRKDILSIGAADGRGSRVMVEVYRPGREQPRFGRPQDELAARTAALGGPYALKPATPVEGKFGRVTAYEFTATAGDHARNCLGFVRAFDDPRLQIAGWYCKADAEVVERHAVACAIEGLTLMAAASEPKVQELFASAEQKRTFCAPHRRARGGNIRRNDWIESRRRPPLRRGVAAK